MINVEHFAQFEQAAEYVAANERARYLGGGTLLMRAVNEGHTPFDTLVRTSDSAIAEVVDEGERVFIGAGVTVATILRDQQLDFLHAAAAAVGAPAIRNMASVGGNLFAPSPYGDLAVALLALNGEAVVQEGGRTSAMALDEFFARRSGGAHPLVAGVSIDKPRDARGLRFIKVQRVKPRGSSVITIAACLDVSAGRVKHASVAYGAMARVPVRATGVERELVDASLDERGIEGALGAALEGTDAPTDAIASRWYRETVAPVWLKRLLLQSA